ncbi:MAG: hypothetical protein KAS23_02925 [Anaerohalosphaera sp.]|nr:hypothetical protein [Anaerohalosphaera sp.]
MGFLNRGEFFCHGGHRGHGENKTDVSPEGKEGREGKESPLAILKVKMATDFTDLAQINTDFLIKWLSADYADYLFGLKSKN